MRWSKLLLIQIRDWGRQTALEVLPPNRVCLVLVAQTVSVKGTQEQSNDTFNFLRYYKLCFHLWLPAQNALPLVYNSPDSTAWYKDVWLEMLTKTLSHKRVAYCNVISHKVRDDVGSLPSNDLNSAFARPVKVVEISSYPAPSSDSNACLTVATTLYPW